MSCKTGFKTRAPELLNKQYTIRTNVWSFGYVGYLFSSLKFNFQRADDENVEKISTEFYKVLEKSKIRQEYDGVIFQTIWNMMQPAAEDRSSWEEILQDEDLSHIIKKINGKYPGIIERAFKKERLFLKPLLKLDQDMEDISKSLGVTYGRFINDEGLLADHLIKYV